MSALNSEGIKSALKSVSLKPIAAKVIIKLFFLMLTLNNFVFSGIQYLQKIGCAMGTICAPNYTNFFMAKFEKTYIYPYLNQFSNFYCRFINDIFFIWNGTIIHFQEFIKKLNNHHPTIKFDFKSSKTSIEVLDTTVYKNKEQTDNCLLQADRLKKFSTLYLCSSWIIDKEHTL